MAQLRSQRWQTLDRPSVPFVRVVFDAAAVYSAGVPNDPLVVYRLAEKLAESRIGLARDRPASGLAESGLPGPNQIRCFPVPVRRVCRGLPLSIAYDSADSYGRPRLRYLLQALTVKGLRPTATLSRLETKPTRSRKYSSQAVR